MVKQVIPHKIAQDVIKMMESVVPARVLGKAAQIPGYRVCGQRDSFILKARSKGYESINILLCLPVFWRLASNPRLAMVVMIMIPRAREYYGGKVADLSSRVLMEGAFNDTEYLP